MSNMLRSDVALNTVVGSWLSRPCPGLLASLGCAAVLLTSAPAAAVIASAPSLGSSEAFSVTATTITNANAGTRTIVGGRICYTGIDLLPMSIVGVAKTPCDVEIGDQVSAIAAMDSQSLTCEPVGGDVDLSLVTPLGSTVPGTFPPGCYKSTGAMTVGSTLILSGNGVYVFLSGGAIGATASGSVVSLLNGACASDVYWRATNAATLGANSTFMGTIFANGAITISDNATVYGRAWSAPGTVSITAATINAPGGVCAAVIPPPVTPPGTPGTPVPPLPPTPVPTMPEWAMIMLAALLAIAGFAAMRRRAQ